MLFVPRLALTCGIIISLNFTRTLFACRSPEVAPLSQIRFGVEEDTMVQTLPTIKDKMAEIRITHYIDLSEALDIKRPEIRRSRNQYGRGILVAEDRFD